MKTVGVIIGVSRYKDLEDLPAAEHDALLFARALRNWGIDEDNLFILLNEKATVETLTQCFEVLRRESDPCKFIFYFCGHGIRTAAPDPHSFLALSDAPYSLDQLMQEIYQLNSCENTLFIDACYLRINTLVNPQLENEIRQKKGRDKSLFCLFSSGIKESFEDIEGGYGYFTRALLKSLSFIRTKKKNLTEFVESLYAELDAQGLCRPEMFNFETHRLSFLPELKGRREFLAHIQDLLARHPEKAVALIGEKGIGKTTIGKQLACEKCRSFYTRVVPENIPLYALTILDDSKVKEWPNRGQWIVISDHPLALSQSIEIEIPPLEYGEAILLFNEGMEEKTKELIYAAAKGNPQRMIQILQHTADEKISPKEMDALGNAIGAIAACGGYLNEELFALNHEIDLNHLHFMEKVGLTIRTSHGAIPHEDLIDIAQKENLPLHKGKALGYWCQQLDQTPEDVRASQSFIITLKCLGYESIYETHLEQAVSTLSHDFEAHASFLKDVADIYVDEKLFTKVTLHLIDIFLEHGFLDLAEQLLKNGEKNKEAQLRKRHYLWRKGQFKLAQALPLTEGKMQLMCQFNRGCASFFLGEWDKAKEDFQKVYDQGHGSLKNLALCLLGSVLAFSGQNSAKGKELLEIGTRLLTKQRDFKSAWVGWNNLGELLWRIGEFRSSAFHLQKALDLAFTPSARHETMRNLLELSLRTKGAFAKETESWMNAINTACQEPFEEMQRLNTLAFAFLLRKQNQDAREVLEKALILTESNPYMHQKTLANLALLQGDYAHSTASLS